jgi:hypothetical protein
VADELEQHDRQLVADLYAHPGFEALKRRARKLREDYYFALASDMYAKPAAVTEAALNEKRAYFKGMARILNEAWLDAKDLERDLARKGTE